jgi:hypothetical protein
MHRTFFAVEGRRKGEVGGRGERDVVTLATLRGRRSNLMASRPCVFLIPSELKPQEREREIERAASQFK